MTGEATTCVMVVEADVLIRAPLAAYLRECGYRVVEARDADEAKVLLDSSEMRVSVVLAEGEAGLVLGPWMRARHADVEMIRAGSVARATAAAGELCEDGPAETRPYDHQFVLAEIRRALATRGGAN